MKKQPNPSTAGPVSEAQPPLEIEYWPVGRPVDYPQNARKWTQKAIAKVRTSIREFGFRQPVVGDVNGVIIIGHLRRRAARDEGLETIPVHVAKELSPEQVRQLRLMDNRSHDEAEWDLELLSAEMKELAAMDLDLSLTGFEQAEFVSFMAGINAGDPAAGAKTLAERFGVPPFSVLDARQGYWQDRKAAWLLLGIQSELGRGGEGDGNAPGGSKMPARAKNGALVRGDSRARPIEA